MEEIEYKCNICKKFYKNSKSLWKHNYNFHKKPNKQYINSAKHLINIEKEDNKIYFCKICNKSFNFYQSRWRHEKTCKKEDKNDNKIKLLEKEIEKLKEMFQQQLKIHPKTLNKINNQLNNSGTINNITIVQLGRENLSEHITEKEKRNILNRQAMGINDLVDLVHVSDKYKKFINVYITNMQNTIAYRYDEKMNNFIAVNKNELLNDLIDARIYDIEKFFEEIGPSLDPLKAEKIKSFIERINDEKDELKSIKKDEIKLLLYNNLDKIKQSCKNPDIIKIENNEIEL